MSEKYDVIIVGAGPAGIFAALELSQKSDARVAIFDKGPAIEKRYCPARAGKECAHCKPCSIMTGWGGAGAFSDGKLTLSPASGGHLGELLGEQRAQALIDEVDCVYVEYGASKNVYGSHSDEYESLEKRDILAGLRLVSVPIRHIGTERSAEIMGRMYKDLVARGVHVAMRTPVAKVLVNGGSVVGIETERGEVFEAPHVIIAPGREGAEWIKRIADELELALVCNPVDVGVRVELPAVVTEPVTQLLYEFKFLYYSRAFDDLIRTFCLPGNQPLYCQQEDGQVVLKQISDYCPGESVLTFDFAKKTFAFVKPQAFTCRHYAGQVYRVQVVGNGAVETTADHLFFVADEDEYVLKRADELCEGDLIPVARDFKLLQTDNMVLNLLEEFQMARLERKQIMHLPIREITTCDFEGEVYDFVIPSTQNFVAGQLPFVVHNCVCPYGEVSLEHAGDVITVNGHSYADRKTKNTNFALLVSKNFTEPFDDPVTYGQSIARLANILSGGILVQRLGDLEAGRRTNAQRLSRSLVTPTLTSATPGDLGLVLPYRHIVNLLEMLHALDKIMPGVCSRHTLLYGVEVKFYSNRLELTQDLKTQVRGLYACGDGAGITRGLIQASASGLLAARAILGNGQGSD